MLSLSILVFLWLFWGLYVLVMGLYRAYLNKQLTKLTICLGAPFLAIGLTFDVIANIFIATFVFAELPKEFLVTSRLTRYVNKDTGWRNKIANAICDNILDVFDPNGDHC